MIKVFAFLHKLEKLTDEQFHALWRHPHGTLTKALKQIHRYVQNHPGPGLPRPAEIAAAPYDGVPELWVERMELLTEMYSDPAYAPLAEDALQLYDQQQLAWLIADQHTAWLAAPARDPKAVLLKSILFLRERPNGPALGAALELDALARDAMPGLAGYARSSASKQFYTAENAPRYHTAIELWFADALAFDEAWVAATRRGVFDLLRESYDVGTSHLLMAREERVIWPPYFEEKSS